MSNKVKRTLEKMYDGQETDVCHENGTFEESTNRNSKLPRVSNNNLGNSGGGTLPYRLLFPRSCIGVMVGKSGTTVKEIQVNSGASVRFQKDPEGGAVLSPEKIVTISGTVEQKNKALQLILDKILSVMKMHNSEGKETIIAVVPQKSVSMIIGVKGQRIQELSKSSCCEIQVHKEYNTNLNERTVSVRSSEIPKLVCGVASVYELLANLVEAGKLSEADFANSFESSSLSTNLHVPVNMGLHHTPHHHLMAHHTSTVYQGQSSSSLCGDVSGGIIGTYNSVLNSNSNNLLLHPLGNQVTRAPTKFVVCTESAAWIVGKSGAHIRDIKRQTGAEFVISECSSEDSPLTDNDRVISIRGTINSKYNVLKLIIPTMEHKPWNADKPLRFLIPSKAVSYIIGHKGVVIKQLIRQTNANIKVENNDAPEGERLVYLRGSPEAKTAAAIAMLQKLEEYENPEIAKEGLFMPMFVDTQAMVVLGGSSGSSINLIHQDCSMSGGLQHFSSPPMFCSSSNSNASWGMEDASVESHFICQAQKYTNPRVLTTAQQFMIEIALPRAQMDAMLHMEKLGSASPFLDIAQRSGCQVRLGMVESNGMSRSITLTGTPMANSIGLLLLQERLMDIRKLK